jgi:hypothetical protein
METAMKAILKARLPLAAAMASMAASAVAGEMQDGRCGGVADENFICGPVNAEDLVKVPGTDWVLASRMAGPGVSGGAIYLLNASDHRWRSLDLDAFPEARDTALYPDCPGKPTASAFSGHGIALDKNTDALKLLAINHGGREAIEVFSLTANAADEPTLTWSGCVVAPQNAMLNSVVALPENGIAVTKFFDPSNKSWGDDLFAGKPTGNVLEWSPSGGWTEVEGTGLSGPNGLAISPDASAYFVAEWGARKLHKFTRGTSKHQAIDTGVLADNVHWDESGKLLLTGQDVADKQEYAACALSDAQVCPDAFKVLRVDPGTLTAEEVVSRPGTKEFGSGTTALDLGSEYWVGTSRGNRIARFAKP